MNLRTCVKRELLNLDTNAEDFSGACSVADCSSSALLSMIESFMLMATNQLFLLLSLIHFSSIEFIEEPKTESSEFIDRFNCFGLALWDCQ